MKTIVIGGGNWGTTLAWLLSMKHGNSVSLWTNSQEHAVEINNRHENIRYLTGVTLPDEVRAVKKFTEAVRSDDIIIIAVPSSQVRCVAAGLKAIDAYAPIVCASKGFEHESFKTMSEVIADELPHVPVIVLTGPNIAREIAERKPSKAVLASKDFATVARVARQLKNDYLTFEICNDVKGVELCAALKGIIAIGVGIADGLSLGNNFTGLLMTYGLREFTQIAAFLNISPKTIYGIAGLGDLIATCLSSESRNRRFGYLLGNGADRDSALQKVGMVVEGVQMAKTIAELENLNIAIPLFAMISKIIFEPNGHLPNAFIHCLTNYKVN